MHWLIAVAAFMLAGAAVAADSNTFQLRHTDDLVLVCSVTPDDAHYANAAGFCHGLLVGAYRYYESTVTVDNRFICPPNPIPTRAKVMNGFVAWAKSHPQRMKESAIDTLFRYLAETYPCKK